MTTVIDAIPTSEEEFVRRLDSIFAGITEPGEMTNEEIAKYLFDASPDKTEGSPFCGGDLQVSFKQVKRVDIQNNKTFQNIFDGKTSSQWEISSIGSIVYHDFSDDVKFVALDGFEVFGRGKRLIIDFYEGSFKVAVFVGNATHETRVYNSGTGHFTQHT